MLRLLLALVFIMHGIGHSMGFLESWTRINVGFADRPWILPGAVAIDSAIGRVFGVLWLLAMVGFVAAGWGVLTRADWWQALAIASAAVSLIAIVPWWSTVPPGASYGGTLVSVLTLVALLGPWRDPIVQAVR
jgi:hypothetical protein